MRSVQVKYFLVFLMQMIVLSASAQITVHFLDQNGESVVGVKSHIFSTDGAFLVRGISDNQGRLIIESSKLASQDMIRIKANSIGYKSVDSILFIEREMVIYLEDDYQDKSEVVVTAQYNTKSAENSVHKIKVIDRTKIDAMGAVTLRDVLSNELGVRLAQDNILGSSMTLQGISGQNVKILIDGVPVVGRLDGNIDVSQINLQEIERIEIVEGPLSVNYGTNALAGVINLISKKPKFKQVSGSVASYYESVGHYNANVELNYGSKFHAFGISVGRNFFDGWREDHTTFRNPIPIADSNRFMTWKPKEQLFGGAFFQWNKNGWFVRSKLNFFTETIINRGYPRAPYQETAFDDQYTTRRIDKSVTLKKKISKDGIFNSLFAYNRYDRIKNTYFIDLTTLDQQLTNNPSDQDTSMFDQWVFRGSFSSLRDSAKLNFQVGYDILIESASGRRISDTRQTQSDFALFATAEYQPIRSLVIRPGLRYAYNTTYPPPVLPSLNVKWKFAGKWNLRASYAKGFRSPGIKELYFEFVDINHNILGNEDLNAESSNNFLSSITHRRTKDKWSLETELNGFYNSIANRITLASIQGTEFTYVNIGKFQSQGIRLTSKFTNEQLIINGGVGWIGSASNIISDELLDDFLFYPELQSSVIYSISKTKTSLAVFYKYQGKLPNFVLDDEGNANQRITEDYHLLDLTVTQQLWKNRLSFTLGAKNVLNVTQIVSNSASGVHSNGGHLVSVGTGRTYFASVKLNLRKAIKPHKK